MNFLHPSEIWLLVLVAAPIILHFLFRQRVQRIVFSAMRFLRKQQREVLNRKRWLEWLLTLIRALAVALLVIAFLRPFIHQHKSDDANAKQNGTELVAILLDESRSMKYGDHFAQAQAEAQKIVDAADDKKQIRIITFSDTATSSSVDPKSKSEAADIISAAQPTDAGTDIADAMDRAAASVSTFTGGEVHLISDIQETALGKQRDVRHLPRGFTFQVHSIAGDVHASGVSLAGAVSSLEIMQRENNLEITVRAINRGDAEDKRKLQLIVDGKPIATRIVSLPARDETPLTISGTVRDAGEHTGHVELDDVNTVIPGDNSFAFIAHVVSKIKVAVVNGIPNEHTTDDTAFYIVQALNAGDDSPYQAVAYPKLPPLRDVNVVVLAGVTQLPSDDVKRLDEFVRAGGGLLIGLTPGIDPAAFNTSLGDLSAARLREWKETKLGAYLTLNDKDLKDPLITRIRGENGAGDFSPARFTGEYQFKDSQGARVMLNFDDTWPAFLERPLGKGDVLLFAGAFDMRGGNFPLRAIFVPTLRESVRFLSARGEQSGFISPGDTVQVNNAELKLPSGKTVQNQANVIVTEAGIYSITTGTGNELFAVNPSPDESNLNAADPKEVEAAFAPLKESEIRTTADGSFERVVLPEEKLKEENRQNIGWKFLWIVVGLIGLELWLSHIVTEK